MENEFKQDMSERTEQEIATKLTSERDGYHPIALKAAKSGV